MSDSIDTRQTGRRLLQLGLFLFLMGLLTGFMMPFFANTRMGLTSHLEGVLNGMFLIGLGLYWHRLAFGARMRKFMLALALYGTFANWLATLLAAFWGAGSMMHIASAGFAGTPGQEFLISFMLYSLSFCMIGLTILLIYGLRGQELARA